MNCVYCGREENFRGGIARRILDKYSVCIDEESCNDIIQAKIKNMNALKRAAKNYHTEENIRRRANS